MYKILHFSRKRKFFPKNHVRQQINYYTNKEKWNVEVTFKCVTK